MRKLVVLLMILPMAIASCDDYVLLAVNEFGSSCIYPECFGAAGMYREAAFCYADSGDSTNADLYFSKAAEYYLQGASYMDTSGDYPLRAPSYERAGDMVAQLGNRYLASEYYDSAIEEYLKIDNYAQANLVNQKKEALHEVPEPATGWAISSESLAIGILVVLIAVVAFIYFKTPNRPEEPVLQEKPVFKLEAPKKYEEPDDRAKASAKEKMRDKIRKKYGLE